MTTSHATCGDVVYDRPAARPVEGHPIGNGRMGTMVWSTPDAIEFQINRVDVFAANRNAAGRHFNADAPTTDYCGGCARVRIRLGGEPMRDGPAFRQQLSLHDALCTIWGEGMDVECRVAAEDDLLIVTVNDRREHPRPIDISLAMWRPPEVRQGAHTALYAFRRHGDGVTVVQRFREGDHYCASAVAARALARGAQTMTRGERAWTLRLPAARTGHTVLVASAASWDDRTDPGGIAERLLDAVACPEDLQAVKQRHAQWWRQFWSRTQVSICSPDGIGEQAGRDRLLFLYHMASSSRGAFPPKWNGSIFITEGDTRAWGSQFWLWTTEVLYWPLLAADGDDLAVPFFELYRRALPALATAARQRWNANGIYLPETMPCGGPAELPEDVIAEYRSRFLHGRCGPEAPARLADCCAYDWHLATLTSKTAGDNAGYSWISHLASSGAELAVHAWWQYRYTGDLAWLRSHAYPLLRGVAEFYRSLARRGEEGRWHIHNTNAHEDFWGVTDGIMDLAAVRGTLPLAIRAAEILDTDAELRPAWQAFVDELAPYPLGADPRAKALTGGALADNAWAAGYLGEVDGSHNPEDVQLTPIFPFEDWTLETREAGMDTVAWRTLELALRHRRVLRGEALNTAIRSPIAAVRAGQGDALPAILDRYREAFSPLANGFSLFEGENAHSVEHLGLLTMVLQEALLQSASPRPGEPEVIRVFPAWPRAWDAEFRLLARGGFLVSAAIRNGGIQAVEIESRRGEECRIRNPWPGPCAVSTDRGRPVAHTITDDDLLVFPTESGVAYRVVRSAPTPQSAPGRAQTQLNGTAGPPSSTPGAGS